ncbi:MAG: tRNA pseudouridine(55) synthase TruB [Candidatus Eremiobacteraeota bacterium]|nr:tRNA pseudouridine(55) synthase TruB [Candidatus Eremiobacteraeota bacterium]
MNGFLNVLKPPGMTSHDVVAYLRRTLAIKKVGHLGTLDPGAAGVLPVALGFATRLAEHVPSEPKGYRAELQFGLVSDSYDAFGAITETGSPECPDFSLLESSLCSFRGIIEQRPPMASSVRVQGRHLYEYYREGLAREAPLRKVKVSSLKIVSYSPPRLIIDVECGEGTYVRSLCHDIGQTLGCGAILTFLVRWQSGIFRIENAMTPGELAEGFQENRLGHFLVPPGQALQHMPVVRLDEGDMLRVLKGAALRLEKRHGPLPQGGERLRLELPDGTLAALGEVLLQGVPMLKPVKVFLEGRGDGDDKSTLR